VEEDSRAEEKAEIFSSTNVVRERTESNGGNEVQTVNNLQTTLSTSVEASREKLWGE